MLEQLKQRLEELKSEYSTGQVQLSQMEHEAETLRQTLLRIAGAIQVMEEAIAEGEAS